MVDSIKPSTRCSLFLPFQDSNKSSLPKTLTSIAIAGIFSCVMYRIYNPKRVVNDLPVIKETPSRVVAEDLYKAKVYSPLPAKVKKRMQGKSYKDNCPVSLNDLAYLRIRHYDMNRRLRVGELVFHKNLALEIAEIFKEIFKEKFPIKKMVLIDNYNADDDLSMEDNNTSAFCSRAITGKKGKFSLHSYGGTIDINPKFNPYVKITPVDILPALKDQDSLFLG